MGGQVLAVASGKGGVGKTTTVVNLGVVLRRSDHSVALVDADLGMANLDAMLRISAEATIHDVLAGEATVEEAVVEEAPGFAVLLGSRDLADYADAAPEGLGDVLDTLADAYDYVIVDTGAGMSHEDVLPLGLADGVLLVTSPDPAAVGDTQKTAELADLAEGAVAGVVVTKADESTDADAVAEELSAELFGVIPYDPIVRSSTASATPLEAADPDAPAAVAYRALGETVAERFESTKAAAAVEEAVAAAEDPTADTTAGGEADSTAGGEAETDAGDDEAPADPPAEAAGPAEADAEDGEEGAEDGEEGAEDGDADDEDLEEYLEEFEDVESAPPDGFFAKLRRLLR